MPLQGKLSVPPRLPEHPAIRGQAGGWPPGIPPNLHSPTQGFGSHLFPPSCGPQEASGVAFIHKDQGTISRGEAADLLQGCDVAIHRKGPISGHQAQSMFLQGRQTCGSWCHKLGQTTHPAWGSKSSLCPVPSTAVGT